MSQETIEKTFNVDAPARLTLSNIRGSVEILPGKEGLCHVSELADQYVSKVEEFVSIARSSPPFSYRRSP